MRYLIVNADDFGQSAGVNHGIIQAHEHGILTSTSMMVRWPAAAHAAAYAREHPRLSVGLHLDLGEWVFRTENWEWERAYEVVPLEDARAVAEEITRQLAAFRGLMGRDPTHLDSHQHVHLGEPLRALVLDLARELGVPVRRCTPTIAYCGEFYGQTAQGLPFPEAISVDHLIEVLAALQPGITELACHPGEGEDLETMYQQERAREVAALCDPRVRSAVASLGLVLCSFSGVNWREASRGALKPHAAASGQ